MASSNVEVFVFVENVLASCKSMMRGGEAGVTSWEQALAAFTQRTPSPALPSSSSSAGPLPSFSDHLEYDRIWRERAVVCVFPENASTKIVDVRKALSDQHGLPQSRLALYSRAFKRAEDGTSIKRCATAACCCCAFEPDY